MKIEAILEEMEQAYPRDIFPDTTKGEREDVIERYPGFIDRTSAMAGRHLVEVIRRKLAEPEDLDRVGLKIYVAGPYTKGDVVVNVRKAVEAANDIRSMGHTPFVPHLTHLWHMIIPHEVGYWYAYDIEWLMECDALFRLPGESKGADEEVRIAQEQGKPVYYSYEEIP